jgi:hypothetical protein
MHSRATVVIPFDDRILFVSSFNRAELVRWFSEIAQPLDTITGSQFRVGSRGLSEWWSFRTI